MTRSVVKRSIDIRGHRTSVSLEAPFWDGLRELAAGEGRSVAAFVAAIDAKRAEETLSSALRVAVLAFYRQRARAEDGATPET